jgi:hypothetical protein
MKKKTWNCKFKETSGRETSQSSSARENKQTVTYGHANNYFRDAVVYRLAWEDLQSCTARDNSLRDMQNVT